MRRQSVRISRQPSTLSGRHSPADRVLFLQCFPAAASPRTSAGAPHAMIMHPTLNPATKGPWIPEPALAFGDESMHFQPVTAHTGAHPGQLQRWCLGYALSTRTQLGLRGALGVRNVLPFTAHRGSHSGSQRTVAHLASGPHRACQWLGDTCRVCLALATYLASSCCQS
jgi:hypothetical protein